MIPSGDEIAVGGVPVRPLKPVDRPHGADPWTNGAGITMYKSSEVPSGSQAIWTRLEGGKYRLVGIFGIGEPLKGVNCAAVTLNHVDYEAVKKSEIEGRQLDRHRRFHDDRFKLPGNAEERVKRRLIENFEQS